MEKYAVLDDAYLFELAITPPDRITNENVSSLTKVIQLNFKEFCALIYRDHINKKYSHVAIFDHENSIEPLVF
jgi:hypothetical protein